MARWPISPVLAQRCGTVPGFTASRQRRARAYMPDSETMATCWRPPWVSVKPTPFSSASSFRSASQLLAILQAGQAEFSYKLYEQQERANLSGDTLKLKKK